jgi:hypothetical protein
LLSSGGSDCFQTSLFLDFGFGAVLIKKLEQLGGGILVEGVWELRDGRGNFEALVEDDLLALQADVFGPFDKASEVGLGADVLACHHEKFEIFSRQ